MPTPTVEDYMLAIYSFEYEKTEVIAARLAERLDVSPPTVSATIDRMVRDGYVQVDPNHAIRLTASGSEMSEKIARRHRLIERWLADALGLEWSAIHEEADRLEHAISDVLEDRISESLGHPETCPHGNPIPGNVRTWSREGLVELSELALMQNAEIIRISELIEEELDLLEYLQSHQLVPGIMLLTRDRTPNGTVVVEIDGQIVPVDNSVSSYIWVRPT
tara:strand:- start:245 stop:904 length:660 start_codon:yes stop_codon:yes gene_type:complete